MTLAARFRPLLLAVLAGSYATVAFAAEPITIESLLNEMTDRGAVAKFPVSDFRLKQASSYNRVSVTPEEPKKWFSNKDYNNNDKDKNFVRIEENDGRREWVLMDAEGPGTIVRTWMPWRNQKSDATTTIIRFYLDGETEPALEGNQFELLNGDGRFPYPLAHKSIRSAVSFFPINYTKGCKVTVSERPFFYQFTYRDYPEGTDVETFSMARLESARAKIDATAAALLDPQVSPSGKPITLSATLAPGEQKSIEMPAGFAAIRKLALKLGNYDDPNVTRSVVLKMQFDGKETVWCPIGDFFGSGIGLHPFQGWYRTVEETGQMTSRWVMPYQESAVVTVENLGTGPVEVALAAETSDWDWDTRSMYFHAGWRGQYPVPTRPFSDWNYVTTQGRGVYVGDTLTIMNPVEKWWGEGDEKIFVDGEDFPSIFGTGTEDYYGYSWGGRSNDFYEHPFHGQPRCFEYNKLNRKTGDGRNTQGFTTEYRTRALDTMPFGSSLQLDMEVWSWTDCDMGYGVGVYWYGDAETTSNRTPDPAAALDVPPLP